MSQSVKLSVTVITFNEERNIGRCLNSVKEVADEILVVDSLSTDRTTAICLEKGAKVISQPFLGHVQQKNFAIDHAKHQHVLSLDADEALSSELISMIKTVKENWVGDAYEINRSNNYCGHWLKHSGWYPDRKTRLWDKEKGRWGGLNPHDKVIMQEDTTIGRLNADLLHYPYYTIDEHMTQANKFSTIAAKAYYDDGKRASILNILVNPTIRFLRDFFVKRGFLDGFYGFVACSICAYMTLLKFLKLRELQKHN